MSTQALPYCLLLCLSGFAQDATRLPELEAPAELSLHYSLNCGPQTLGELRLSSRLYGSVLEVESDGHPLGERMPLVAACMEPFTHREYALRCALDEDLNLLVDEVIGRRKLMLRLEWNFIDLRMRL